MTLDITDIELFTLLKAKIGEKEATAVIDYVKQETVSGTKKTKEVINKDIASLQMFLDEKFKGLDEKFRTQEQTTAFKLEQTKTDLIKWLFGFFVTIILMIIGMYFKK